MATQHYFIHQNPINNRRNDQSINNDKSMAIFGARRVAFMGYKKGFSGMCI